MRAVAAIVVALVAAAPTTSVAQSTPADYMAAIEGPQESAGGNGLGELTIQELMDRFNVPGVSVAVIKDFEIHWARGYGVADLETGAPVDPETMFQAASISKPVAAMAVLKAVQDGLFGLDDDKGKELAFSLGQALQLTNILRDIPEDAERDRLYIPEDLLRSYDVVSEDLPFVLNHPEFPKVCDTLAGVAERRFQQAETAIAHSGLLGHIGERPSSVVSEETIRLTGLTGRHPLERRSVDEVDVEIGIAVVVEERDSRTHRLDDVVLLRCSREMREVEGRSGLETLLRGYRSRRDNERS